MPRATFAKSSCWTRWCIAGQARDCAVVELSLPGVQVVTGAASQQRRTTAGNEPRDRTAVRHGRGQRLRGSRDGGALRGGRDRRGFERHREFLSLTTRTSSGSVRGTMPGALTSIVCEPKPNIKFHRTRIPAHDRRRAPAQSLRNRQDIHIHEHAAASDSSSVCSRFPEESGLRSSCTPPTSCAQPTHSRKLEKVMPMPRKVRALGLISWARRKRIRASSKRRASYSASPSSMPSVGRIVRRFSRSAGSVPRPARGRSGGTWQN